MKSSRNLYRDEVDFKALALQSPEFAKYLKENGQLDFSDPAAVRQLTTSLLARDFKLTVDLPPDRLCPPVPNRLNYILWLQDLLDTTGRKFSDEYDSERPVVGLDIGTGCCAIYPLLGCSLRPRWKFIATDIDDKNVELSRRTVSQNNLSSRINIRKTTAEDPLIPDPTVYGYERLDFTMCNPPFYSSEDEMVSAAAAKNRPPFSACTGAKVEMITPGGEVAFVSQMIEESLRLRDKVQWYTTMLGKLSSVSVIVQNLIDCGNKNWAVTEFVQGNRTKRWAVGWSWTDLRPAVDAARGLTSSSIPKHLLPFPSEFTFHAASTSIDKVCRDVDGQMRALPRSAWTWQPMRSRGVLLVKEDVWSRRARRKFQQQQQQQDQDKLQQTSADVDESNAALGVAVQVKQELDTSRGPTVLIRWLKGSDHVLYESFCGMLKRKLTEK